MSTSKTSEWRDDLRLARRVWKDALTERKWYFLAAIIMMSIEGSMVGLLAYMLQPMFDRVFVAGSMTALWIVGLLTMGLFMLRGFAGIGHKVLLSRAMESAGAKLQHRALTHILTLDGQFHQTHPPGALIERVQGDIGSTKGGGAAIITGLGRDLVSIISLVTVAALIDPLWTLIALLAVPLLVAPSTLVQRFTRTRARQAREIAARMTTLLDEVFHGVVQVKLNRLEDYQGARYQGLQRSRVRIEVENSLGQAMIPGLVDVMVGIGFLLVLYVGGREIISGEKTVGQFMSFFMAMALMFEPVRRVAALSGVWQNVAAALIRFYTVMDTQPTIVSPARPKAPPTDTTIVFDDVHLAYTDTPVLRGLSFTAEAGKTTALVGASGAGKSTVFNALTRLVDPSSGRVLLGGVPVSELALGDLRRQFSMVTQEALLFDETLSDNLLLDRPDTAPDAVAAAIEAAHLSHFIESLPDGLETRAGPRGSSLSGGQRQRMAIARAVLRDAPILLLDEATSALDAESERAVQDALDTLSENRTTLVIAHRLATVRAADKIVVMEAGRVVEQGSEAELLAKRGAYARLHALQFAD